VRARGSVDQRLLVLVTLGLVAFGLVMVYSATSAAAALGDGDPMAFLERQSAYALLGVGCLLVASRLDYHKLRYLAPPLLLAALALCVAVLAVAPEINGARRWFVVGPASFQPSELAKLSLVLFAAAHLARRRPPRTLGELAKPLGFLTALFCGLILLEPDLGTTISLCLTMFALLLVAGIPLRVLTRRSSRSRWERSRSGSSRTGGRASSASSIPGATRRARASRSCRR
jgi:cell division protein FtsW